MSKSIGVLAGIVVLNTLGIAYLIVKDLSPDLQRPSSPAPPKVDRPNIGELTPKRDEDWYKCKVTDDCTWYVDSCIPVPVAVNKQHEAKARAWSGKIASTATRCPPKLFDPEKDAIRLECAGGQCAALPGGKK